MSAVSLKDRYRLESYPIAHSGMGEVWPAQDTLLQRRVVVKMLPPTDDIDLMRRFRREALLTARLAHPGVPRVFDLGEHRGRPYLVMEEIGGVNLADLSAEHGPLAIAWVVAIGMQVSAVLMAAQEIGLVHRDIKPSNIMLEPSGAVKVLDFGLAAIRQDERYSRITTTGQSLGTVGYMAPEQVNAEPTDHRTDLYGLGGTLFHLLTGAPPFDGRTTMTTVRHQLADPPPRPATLRPDTPPPLDELIHALLAFDPARRPPSAAEVYAALGEHAGPRPPIPGVIAEGGTARAYVVAAAGTAPSAAEPPAPPRPRPADEVGDEAERLFASGEYRAAARSWRQLADQCEQQHGEDHPQVFAWRRRAAQAHIQLGEHDRAARQLDALLARRIQTVGPDHDSVRELREEIDRLRSRRSTRR